ncbi:hypothetical protein SOV_22500 [Sporomusa ovata DSM 2662]|nr:hypothetical protein SOV_4c02290 [Sporomusa ovata DSM 2662]
MSEIFVITVGIVVFLVVANGYCHGYKTETVDALLGLVSIACLVYGFYKYKLFDMLYLLGGSFVWGNFCNIVIRKLFTKN